MAGSVATGGGGGGAMSAIGEVARLLEANYQKTTPKRLRILDMFLVFVFATGVLQVRYKTRLVVVCSKYKGTQVQERGASLHHLYGLQHSCAFLEALAQKASVLGEGFFGARITAVFIKDRCLCEQNELQQ